jgi:hypothetical protein
MKPASSCNSRRRRCRTNSRYNFQTAKDNSVVAVISCPGRSAAFFTMHRRAGTQGDAECKMGPGSATHHAARHSASKTRVNALMALRSIRGTYPHPCSKFETQLCDLAARCARAVDESSAPKEGVGNAGCPLHPQPRVQCRKHTGSRHRYTGITRHSRTQWF